MSCSLPRLAALAAVRSPAHQLLRGFSGAWTFQPAHLTNEYFKILLGLDWEKVPGFSREEFRVPAEDVSMFLNRNIKREEEGQYVYMTPEDMVIRNDPELSAIAKQYVMNNEIFLQDFSAAWTKIMNADRFKGPTGNECAAAAAEAPAAKTAKTAAAAGSSNAASSPAAAAQPAAAGSIKGVIFASEPTRATVASMIGSAASRQQ
jgi:hypothetical protein